MALFLPVSSAMRRASRGLLCSYSGLAAGDCEVAIAGGGIMGLASAHFLAQRLPPSSIHIIERDPDYKRASTPLSVGSIRQQFSIPANIQMSLFSSHFIQSVYLKLKTKDDNPDVQFTPGSYVFLATKEGEAILRENVCTQLEQGADVELLSPSELKSKYPWINNEGITLASIGIRNEGWFDPWLLLSAFKKKVISSGVNYSIGQVSRVDVQDNTVKSIEVTSSSGQKDTLNCRYLVNASGAWAADVALLAGVGNRSHSNPMMHSALPVKPRKRCVFFFKCPDLSNAEFPMLINNDGWYVRKEGGDSTFIAGISPSQDRDHDGLDLEVDYSLFEEIIWPSLAHRIPAFESLKLQSAWAGYYDYNTLDQNAIIGPHPVIKNLVFSNGFSGHGIQQSPAVGRAVSEIILDGRSHSIDLSKFSFERIIRNEPFKERNIV